MAFRYNIYVNVTDETLGSSETSGTGGKLPPFTVGDTIPLKIAIVERTGTAPTAVFSVVDPTGYSLKVSIGVPAATGATPAAQQTSWTVAGNYFTGSLALNTAAIVAAVSAGTALFFEIEVSVGGGEYQTIYQSTCTVRKEVNPTSSTAPTPAEEFYTKNEANQVFVRRAMGAGDAIVWQSQDGTQRAIQYLHNDGSLRFEPLT
jgi:hypothetical protein